MLQNKMLENSKFGISFVVYRILDQIPDFIQRWADRFVDIGRFIPLARDAGNERLPGASSSVRESTATRCRYESPCKVARPAVNPDRLA